MKSQNDRRLSDDNANFANDMANDMADNTTGNMAEGTNSNFSPQGVQSDSGYVDYNQGAVDIGSAEEGNFDDAAGGAQGEMDPNMLALVNEVERLTEMNRKLTLSLAHVQNESKMIAKKAEDKASYALSGIAKDMTSIVHTLSLAVGSMMAELEKGPNDAMKTFVDGVQMIMTSLMDAMSKHGIVVFNPRNGMFDSNLHEAISMVPSDAPKGTIVDVLQVGCTVNGRLVVPAKVVVSSGPAQSA